MGGIVLLKAAPPMCIRVVCCHGGLWAHGLEDEFAVSLLDIGNCTTADVSTKYGITSMIGAEHLTCYPVAFGVPLLTKVRFVWEYPDLRFLS